jgi:hypothetical protein
MVDALSFGVYQDLTQHTVVVTETVVRQIVQPESVVIEGPKRVGVRDPAQGGRCNGNDSDSVFEHRGESAHLIDATLHILNQPFLPKVGHGAVQHDASRREGEMAQNVEKVVANFVQRPPPHSYDGGTFGRRRRHDSWHGLVGQDYDLTPPLPLVEIPFFRQESVFHRA